MGKKFHGMKLASVNGKVCIVGDLMVDTIKECHQEGANVSHQVQEEFLQAVGSEHSILSKLVSDPANLAVETSVVKVIDPDRTPTPPPTPPREPTPIPENQLTTGAGPAEEVVEEKPPAPPAEAPAAAPAEAPKADAPPADPPPAEAPPADAPPADAPPADAPPAEETP